MNIKAGIIGTGSYVPEGSYDNFYFEKIMDTSDEWIRTRTGISERRIASEKQATSDLAYEAAKRALADAEISAEDVELIILATASPDKPIPSTACIVQDKLGASNAAAFDISAACSGFIYALDIARRFVENGTHKNVLIIGAETLSRIVDYTDRTTAVLFGDGAGAAVISQTEENGIMSAHIGADGSGGDYLQIPAGGSRLPASDDTVANNMHKVKMAGSDVFKFAVRKMADASKEAIKKAGLELEDIDFLVPHQANIRIIEASAKRLKIDMDKVYVNLDRYGNMSAASVPVALDEAVKEGKIKKGDKVVLVGFGGGLTWASSVLEWTK